MSKMQYCIWSLPRSHLYRSCSHGNCWLSGFKKALVQKTSIELFKCCLYVALYCTRGPILWLRCPSHPISIRDKRDFAANFTTNLQSYHSLVNPSSQQKKKKILQTDEQIATEFVVRKEKSIHISRKNGK